MTNEQPQRILILASAQSYRAAPFIQAAKKLGLDVVVGADIPLPYLDKSRLELPLDYRDLRLSAETIADYAQLNPLGAILGLDDSGTMIAAFASEYLGISHNHPEAALAANNKFNMRTKFAEGNVPSPHFEHHFLNEDMAELAASVNYPCVIKPVTLSGSKGVMRADNPTEFLQRIARLRKILVRENCEEFLVEDYLPGVEVALEGLLNEGELHVLALFDKPDPLEGPFFEETIYTTPSRLPAETQAAIVDASKLAAEALGLVRGPVHAELRVNDDGVWLVELAARSIGGLCGQTLRFETGASLEELIVRQAFGRDLSAANRVGDADGVMMIPIPEHGILKGVAGIEEAKALPMIDDIEITVKVGQEITPLPEGNSYLGFIFASGETPAAVEAALREAHGLLTFELMPKFNLEIGER